MNNQKPPKKFVNQNECESFQKVISYFLVGYRDPTRKMYERQIKTWGHWCSKQKLNVLFTVERVHLEKYAQELEDVRKLKRSTIAHKLSVLSLFYRYCVEENYIQKNPAVNVRRPKVEYITTRLHLDDSELRRFLSSVSSSKNPRDAAICKLLVCNGLRVSEALNANLENIHYEGHHLVLNLIRKGGKECVIPLSPFVSSAIYAYVGERTFGPIFLGVEGCRMDRSAVDRIIKRHCKKVGINKKVSPHSLRHSAITSLLNAGIPLRDVQMFANHKDPRTTSYYDHGRKQLDSNPTYVLASLISGG